MQSVEGKIDIETMHREHVGDSLTFDKQIYYSLVLGSERDLVLSSNANFYKLVQTNYNSINVAVFIVSSVMSQGSLGPYRQRTRDPTVCVYCSDRAILP